MLCGSPGQGATVNVSLAPQQIVYNTGYKWVGSQNQWVPFTLTGTPMSGSNIWLTGNASASIPSSQIGPNTNFVVAYTCTNVNGQWKCGCKDSTCATNNWQLQAFQQAPSAPTPPTGSTGGGGTPAPTTGGLTFGVDPDGPSGPMTAQTGEVQAKTFMLGFGDVTYALFLSMRNFMPIAYLTWSSSASSCKLTETIAPFTTMWGYKWGYRTGGTTFEFSDLPGSGSATTPLIITHFATAYGPDQSIPAGGGLQFFYSTSSSGPYVGQKHKFTIDCGGKTAIATTYVDGDEFISAEARVYENITTLNDVGAGMRVLQGLGYQLITTTPGPVKLDVLGLTSGDLTAQVKYLGFSRGTSFSLRNCTTNPPLMWCDLGVAFAQLNATSCTGGRVSETRSDPTSDTGLILLSAGREMFWQPGRLGEEGYGKKLHRPPVTQTLTCTGPQGSDSKTINWHL